jgi:hypothetical protein
MRARYRPNRFSMGSMVDELIGLVDQFVETIHPVRKYEHLHPAALADAASVVGREFMDVLNVPTSYDSNGNRVVAVRTVPVSYSTYIGTRRRRKKRVEYSKHLIDFLMQGRQTIKASMFVKSENLGGFTPGVPRLIISPGVQFTVGYGRYVCEQEADGVASGISTIKSHKSFHNVTMRINEARIEADTVEVVGIAFYLCFDGEAWDSSLGRALRATIEVRYVSRTIGFPHSPSGFSPWRYISKTWRGVWYSFEGILKAFIPWMRLSGTAETSWNNLIINTVIHLWLLVYLYTVCFTNAIRRVFVEGDDAIAIVNSCSLASDPHMTKYQNALLGLGIRPKTKIAAYCSSIPVTETHRMLLSLGVKVSLDQVGLPEICSRYLYHTLPNSKGEIFCRSMHAPERICGKVFVANRARSDRFPQTAKATALTEVMMYANIPIFGMWSRRVYMLWSKEELTIDDVNEEMMRKLRLDEERDVVSLWNAYEQYLKMGDIAQCEDDDRIEFDDDKDGQYAFRVQLAKHLHESIWLDYLVAPYVTFQERRVFTNITGISAVEQRMIENEIDSYYDGIVDDMPLLYDALQRIKP